MLNEKERKIKEHRTHEAMKKKLMGPGGKLGIVVKYLGSKIMSQNNSPFHDVKYMDNCYETEDQYHDSGNVQEGSEEDFVSTHGWHFDGLSRGKHLEIRYLDHHKELTAHYKGYLIFQEISGDLVAFSPQDDWEEIIEQLYASALVVKSRRDKVQNQDDKEKRTNDWLQKVNELRLKWGL